MFHQRSRGRSGSAKAGRDGAVAMIAEDLAQHVAFVAQVCVEPEARTECCRAPADPVDRDHADRHEECCGGKRQRAPGDEVGP